MYILSVFSFIYPLARYIFLLSSIISYLSDHYNYNGIEFFKIYAFDNVHAPVFFPSNVTDMIHLIREGCTGLGGGGVTWQHLADEDNIPRSSRGTATCRLQGMTPKPGAGNNPTSIKRRKDWVIPCHLAWVLVFSYEDEISPFFLGSFGILSGDATRLHMENPTSLLRTCSTEPKFLNILKW